MGSQILSSRPIGCRCRSTAINETAAVRRATGGAVPPQGHLETKSGQRLGFSLDREHRSCGRNLTGSLCGDEWHLVRVLRARPRAVGRPDADIRRHPAIDPRSWRSIENDRYQNMTLTVAAQVMQIERLAWHRPRSSTTQPSKAIRRDHLLRR